MLGRRWEAAGKLTRQIGLGLKAAFGLASVWVILAGAIFEAAPADEAMKFWMALFVGVTLIEMWHRIAEEDAVLEARRSGEILPPVTIVRVSSTPEKGAPDL